jgi:phytoene dehydrogenase-like protein
MTNLQHLLYLVLLLAVCTVQTELSPLAFVATRPGTLRAARSADRRSCNRRHNTLPLHLLDCALPATTSDDDFHDEQTIESLLDDAILLYQRSQVHETRGVTVDWLLAQIISFIEYLAARVAIQPTDGARTAQQLAFEIDRQLILLHRGSATANENEATLENLVVQYRRARRWDSRQDSRREQLRAAQRQLVAWGSLVESFPSLSSVHDLKRSHSIGKPARSGLVWMPRTTSTALRASRVDVDPELEHDDENELYSSKERELAVDDNAVESVDVAIVGGGIAALCAGAILNTLYKKKVGVYESHYLPGGCAHAFDRRSSSGVTFTFDSGPTILLGCSSPPFNALQQVLNAINQPVEWIPYSGWGMIENPGKSNETRWRVDLGPSMFEEVPLRQFGGPKASEEFKALREITKGLRAGVEIPAMAMRPGPQALIPLLRYFTTLVQLVSQGERTTGTFAPYMDGPLFHVTDPWFRNWLDALAFSLSGLPASRTAAAAMAFVLYDMHRAGASLDYPKGGMGAIIEALVRGVEAGSIGSKVHLRQHVQSIDCSEDGQRITGLTLRSGKRVRASLGVICNAPVWTLRNLIRDEGVLKALDGIADKKNSLAMTAPQSWKVTPDGASILASRDQSASLPNLRGTLSRCDTAEQTGSFLHLHLALNATGLDLDQLEAHYTVMDRGLTGSGIAVNGVLDGPCGELNMIAVSNPCVIDRSLAPEGYIVVHAYGAGNEPYETWQGLDRRSKEYRQLKAERAQVLWRAVESIIPNVRDRVVLELVGSPLTHERYLRRPRGTYGSATEDYLRDGSTPFDSLVIANDGVFPGIGVPAVCIAGASAANAFASILEHWKCLDVLEREQKLLS